ncbi:NAD(P)/FAD-dependent oxidoreductase [Kitasatospora sp. NPDC051170]|uniref:NAD(P)/FAD-dependent oxidoreductase n=1 Tax=Kitasatospora sp. NPDC051170 TaxID=3364056 RepID=UPI0037A10E41
MSPEEPVTAPPWRPVELPPAPPVHGQVRADVAIVGAGLTGLATAHHLLRRDPTLDILVLDATAPAGGASGRGTGLVGPRIGPPVDRARKRFGDDTARACHLASEDWVRQTIALARELETEPGVDCGLDVAGQLVVARTDRAAADLARRADAYRRLDLDVRALPRPEGYRAALRYPVAATLDPAALTTALAADLARRGVRRHDRSPVLRAGGGLLECPGGTVRARRTVLAVNGWARTLRLPVGTVAALQLHAVATEPLPAADRERLGREAVIDATTLAPYHRLTPDGRLVMGGGPVRIPPTSRPASHRHAWDWLARRLPVQARITHRWTGRVGYTGDALPVVGRTDENTWFAGGCCGHGLALATATGAHLAAALTGDAPPPRPWHRDRAPWLPVDGPAGMLVRGYLRVLANQAGKQPY